MFLKIRYDSVGRDPLASVPYIMEKNISLLLGAN
jgi:hypothetical protein